MNLICFSHLRWNSDYPLPQYILSRFSQQYVTYFIEESVINNQPDGYELYQTKENVLVVSPHLKHGNFSENEKTIRVSTIIKDFFEEEGITNYLFWYSNPLAFAFTKGFRPKLNIYACMEEILVNSATYQQLNDFKELLSEEADIVLKENTSIEIMNNHLPDSIFLEMQSAIKAQLERKELRKIVKLPRFLNNENFSVTESFGS